jgi:hypothetical protein
MPETFSEVFAPPVRQSQAAGFILIASKRETECL